MSDCGCDEILNNCSDTPVSIVTPTCTTSATCKNYTWSKCVKYEGPNIGCSSTVGGVATATVSGEAFDFGNVTVTDLEPTGGNGSGMVVSISWTTLDLNYTIVITDPGTGYVVGDVLTVTGDLLSGVSPANDATITVSTLSDPVTGVNYQIFVGDTLSEIIQNLNDRICELTPEGVDYSAFEYDCLRQGGALTGTGSAITTAKEFAESVSAALCDIHGRLGDVEIPGITIACIPSLDGTEGIVEVLQEIGDKLCEVETTFALPISVTASCFTTAPSGTDPISDWFQWFIDNTCAINTALTTSISTQTTRIDNINTFLHGSSSPAYPITYDISCLGGSATANLDTTVDAVLAEVCSLSTTVGAIPDLSAITLTWATCFSGSPYSYTSAAQSLQTQLERILNVISREKITTFSSDFVVADSACGKSVSLAAGVGAFSCADLNTCSVHSLQDVQSTTPVGGDVGKVLKWNGTTEYELVALDSFTNIGIVDKSGSYASASLGFYFQAPSVTAPAQKQFSVGFVEESWTAPSLPAAYVTNVTTPLMVKKSWDGHIQFKGVIGSNTVTSSTIFSSVLLATLSSEFWPASTVSIPFSILYVDNSVAAAALVLPGFLTISSTNGQVRFSRNDIDDTTTTAYIRGATEMNNNDMDHTFSFEGLTIYQ